MNKFLLNHITVTGAFVVILYTLLSFQSGAHIMCYFWFQKKMPKYVIRMVGNSENINNVQLRVKSVKKIRKTHKIVSQKLCSSGKE